MLPRSRTYAATSSTVGGTKRERGFGAGVGVSAEGASPIPPILSFVGVGVPDGDTAGVGGTVGDVDGVVVGDGTLTTPLTVRST